ncbi:hypothetical protein Dimus_006666 [Dionaea muscipula]
MAKREENSQQLEWKMDMPDRTSKVLEPKTQPVQRNSIRLKDLVMGLAMQATRFLEKSWKIGVDEPLKFIHCLKVALALSIVSLFYYMRPLYDGVGGTAMWAIMTVVVVFEYTVGAALYKCINRGLATAAGGTLGIGIHWVASHSGGKFEPVILGTSVFILAVVVTFTRFIPAVKAKYDYGALIFILTLSLVSISSYRVEKLWMMAHQRVSTVAIGASLCILISIIFCPVWAGDKLHQQTICNLEHLASSIEGYVAEYFRNDGVSLSPTQEEKIEKKLQEYKCVLNSKVTEESMANYARWEPAHEHFTFGYPWKQYLKIGAAARNCAYSIDNIRSCMDSQMQAPESLKNHIKEECMRLSTYSSEVLKELAVMIKTMRKSSKIDISVGQMNLAVQELYNVLTTLPDHSAPQQSQSPIEDRDDTKPKQGPPAKVSIIEILPLVALVTLLAETVTRIIRTVDEVNKLASLAQFKTNVEKRLSPQELETKILKP